MNWRELRALWDERDHRYRTRKQHGEPLPVTPEEAAAIRQYRQTEVAILPPEGRALAVLELNRWTPPVARVIR